MPLSWMEDFRGQRDEAVGDVRGFSYLDLKVIFTISKARSGAALRSRCEVAARWSLNRKCDGT